MTDGRRIAIVRDYLGLVSALRARAAELKVSRSTLDELAGLQAGYAAKLLAPVPAKSLGRVSLGPMLQTLGLALVLVEDSVALERIKKRFGPHARPDMLSGARHTVVTVRLTRKKLARMASKGGKASMQKLTPKQRTRKAKRAARIRWRRQRSKVDKTAARLSSDMPCAPCAS